MADQFSSRADTVTAPATRGTAVTPNDSAPLADLPKALWVGNGGTLVVRGPGDSGDVTLVGVPSGSVVPYRAHYVRATGTSASAIVALY